VLAWARDNECPWSAKTCTAAAGGGHLATLHYARQKGCPWSVATVAVVRLMPSCISAFTTIILPQSDIALTPTICLKSTTPFSIYVSVFEVTYLQLK
jgi:hypothetical protein